MGYYSERLRQRIDNMTQEEKKALWNKYSYLNDFGPVITSHMESFIYGDDVPCKPVDVPESALCIVDDLYYLAA